MTNVDDSQSHESAGQLSTGNSSGPSILESEQLLRDLPFQRLADKGRQFDAPPVAPREVAPLTPLEVKRIPAGETPHSVTVSPDGRHIYVTNFLPATVSVIDPTLEEVVATVQVVDGPYGVAARPDGKSLHVTSPNAHRVDRVLVPGASTPLDVDVQTGIGHAPYGVAISQDGSRLYVALALDDAILITDAFAKPGDAPPIGSIDFPVGVALSPNGGTLYASNYFDAAITVIDLVRGTAVNKLDVGPHPYGLTVSKDGSRLYIAHFPDGNVSVIDLNSNAAIATIPVEDGPRGVALSPDGRHLYVTSMFAASVSVITL